ncbi:hypothetical protein [Intrasporangium mesophilum]
MRRVVVVLTGAALLLLGSVRPAEAAVPTSVSGWATTSATAAVGYVFSDAVSVKTGSGYVARKVYVQRRSSASTTWSNVSSGTTTGSGAYTAKYAVPTRGVWYFRLYVPSTTSATARATAQRKVTGVAGLTTTLSGWATTATGGAVGYGLSSKVTVTTGTGYVARTVQIQRRPSSSTTWSTIATATTTSAGAYTASYAIPSTGVWYFRMYVPATMTGAAGVTAQRQVTGITGAATSVLGWPTTPAVGEVGDKFNSTVTIKSGTQYVARTVQLQRRPASSTAWTTVSTGTSSSLGVYPASYSLPGAGVWYFRLSIPPTATAAAASTPQRQVTGLKPIAWAGPTEIDPRRGSMQSVSCATNTFCVAVDEHGYAVKYDGQSWSEPSDIGAGTLLTAVSCPSTSFCAAADAKGRIWTSTGTAWTASKVLHPAGLRTVSCASSTLCAAIDFYRNAYVFDGVAWAGPYPVSVRGTPISVSCASGGFCAVVDDHGDFATFSAATHQWSAGQIVTPTRTQVSSISCATASSCVVVDRAGAANRWDGATWSGLEQTNATGLESVSCPSTTFCAAVGSGWAVTFNGAVWSDPTYSRGAGLSVSCPTAAFCTAIDGDYAATYDGTAWSEPVLADPSTGGLWSVSCPSASFCAAISDRRVSTYNGSSWSAPATIFPRVEGSMGAWISCASATSCAAVTQGGMASTWDGSTWSAPYQFGQTPAGPFAPTSLSCPSESFCLAGDGNGYTMRFDGTTWAPGARVAVAVTSLSCASPTFCAAIDSMGRAATFDGVSWTAPSAPPQGRLASVSCPAPSFCIAVGDRLQPAMAYDGTGWAPMPGAPSIALGSVSCASTSFCMATTQDQRSVVTFNESSWSNPVTIDPYGSIGSLSCPSSSFCAAASWTGTAFIGKRP